MRLKTGMPLMIALCMLWGCTQPLNDRLTLGGNFITPTFRASNISDPTNPEISAPTLLAATPKPRDAWTPIQYISPYDGVVHSPLLRVRPPHKHLDTPRNYGLYPTIHDASYSQSLTYEKDLSEPLKALGRTVVGTPYALTQFILSGELTAPSDAPFRVWKRAKPSRWSTGNPLAAPSNLDREDVPDAHE